jgi:hypothetical protein
MPASDFGKIYAIALHESGIPFHKKDKDVIQEAVEKYTLYYQIPRAQQFTNRPAEYGLFTELTAGCLGAITLQDKLLVFAHADKDDVGPYGPLKLCKALHGWGLRKVWFISFKACDVGKGTFLEDFVRACGGRDHSIEVGWVKGYCGESATDTWSVLLPATWKASDGVPPAKPHEKVMDVTGIWCCKTETVLTGEDKVRFIKGTVDTPNLGHHLFPKTPSMPAPL